MARELPEVGADRSLRRPPGSGFGSTWVRDLFAPIPIPEPDELAFEISFWKGVLEHHPEHFDALFELGLLYTRQGDHQHSLETDLKLVALRPDDEVCHYNLACSLTLVGDLDSAFMALQRAVELGYSDLAYLESDRDLTRLRQDRRYKRIVARILDNKARRGPRRAGGRIE